MSQGTPGPASGTPGPLTRQVAALVRAGLSDPGAQVPGDLAGRVVTAVRSLGVVIGLGDVLVLTQQVEDLLWGWGPLAPLMADPHTSDVLVNGPGQVWRDVGSGVERVAVNVGEEAEIRALAVRLAASAGVRLDDALPWADARLPSGVRLHATLPPVSPQGTQISLRLQRAGGFSLTQLCAAGTVAPTWVPLLQDLLAARATIMITGGTGAGKTTLLAALLGELPPGERVVLVEDTGELRPDHDHLVRLEGRRPNVEGKGGVGLDELVRQALRMRPDRIVVGECRGSEVRDLLAALNTGHTGGFGTVHANTCADLPARLQALGSMGGMSPQAVAVQAGAGIDAVLQMQREAGVRRCVELAAVVRRERELEVISAALVSWPGGVPVTQLGPGWPELAARFGLSPPGAGAGP